MNDSINNENLKYINNWVQANPNFNAIIFENGTLCGSNGEKIDIKDYLVSSILNNEYINDNIYSMNEDTFLKAVKLNAKAFEINNTHLDNIDNNEKIKNVKINAKGQAIAETENSKVEITGHKALKVLSTYTSLIADNTVHIPLSTLLKNLSNNKFYELINMNTELSKEDFDYINDFSTFMLDLMSNEKLLCNDAKNLLTNYKFSMEQLMINENRNSNQNVAFNLYNDNLRALNNKIEEENLEKETSEKAPLSLGFSSLFLIITSVVVTMVLIALLLFIN